MYIENKQRNFSNIFSEPEVITYNGMQQYLLSIDRVNFSNNHSLLEGINPEMRRYRCKSRHANIMRLRVQSRLT